MIDALIDKQDTCEVIRDQIANILALETTSQQNLAREADKSPDDWAFRVFVERSNPWEEWLNSVDNPSPLVSVWYDRSTFEPGKSNIVERQGTTGTFNIDCYGLGVATDNPYGGHLPGDRSAAFAAQRALRLVRNILMAAENTYLGLQGLVWQRFPQSSSMMQVQFDGGREIQVVAARLTLAVAFNEFSPQATPVNIEELSVGVLRAEDGEILVDAEYAY